MTDVTELKRAQDKVRFYEEQLARSERLASIGTLAAGVAHEINNPINSIRMLAEFAQTCPEDLNVYEALTQIIEQSDRCSHIVHGILRFARNEQAVKAAHDVNELVRRAVELAGISLPADRLDVRLELGSDLPRVMANPLEIEQVLINLIKNAMEAVAGQAKVMIRTERALQAVHISVRDEGPGIAAERLPHIFDPFYSTRQGAGGTGLGLSICHRIISQHHGRITAASDPARGATFTIELPAWQGHPAREEEEARPERPCHG
jgi:two-component system NtrC family sensor kinase